MHPVLSQVSFAAHAELASHFCVSSLFYRIQYDFMLLFQQAFADLLYPFSEGETFIPLVATTTAVAHSERWSECLSGAASSPLCLCSIAAALFSMPLNWSL